MKTIKILFLFLCFIAFGCEKISDETDPKKIIIGKWEMIEFGSCPNVDPYDTHGEYVVYSNDSIKTTYNPESKELFRSKYWIDSLLHEGSLDFKFEFFDKNQKIRLDFAKGIAEFPTSIWKRIK